MKPLKAGSINRRLARLVLAAVGCATLFMLANGVWQEASRLLSAKSESLLATAGAFAAATAKSVAIHDAEGTLRALRGIDAVSGLSYAAVDDQAGSLLAEIGSGVRLTGDVELPAPVAESNPFSLLFTRSVSITAPIVEKGERVGRLRLTGVLPDLQARLVNVVLSTLFSGLAALVIGVFISLGLQRSITRPLLTLTQAIRTIQASHNYSLRVDISSNDEISVLAANFNDMLSKVSERDRQLVAHRDRLEQDVAERTRDLALATRSAEAANVAKSAFLATMSHEIRTPMNGMLVMAELLAASDLPQRQRRYADVIARSGQSLLAIINDILDFSKIEAGRLTLETAAFAPADVVDMVVTLFAERAAEKGLDLAAFVAPDALPEIMGDSVRVTQVLSNLLNNALKFTVAGHVLISVTADREGRRIRFAVRDTGIGIPANKLDLIFNVFSQADNSTARQFGGTGLGLSICKRLAEAMGGSIEVESKEGCGSTFTFSMEANAVAEKSRLPEVAQAPRAVRVLLNGSATQEAVRFGLEANGFDACQDESERHDLLVDARALAERGTRGGASRVVAVAALGDPAGADAVRRGLADCVIRRPIVQAEWRNVLDRLREMRAFENDTAAQAPDAGAPLPRFAGVRVLVADDSAVNREVACEALARLGIAADAVDNGEAALRAVGAGQYGLVLMDGSMPELDGFEATRRLRAEERAAGRARMPVVALTAHVIGSTADAWREAGMDGVLHKPFTVARLAACLQQHLPAAGTAGDDDAALAGLPETTESPISPLLDRETLEALAEMGQASPSGGFLRRILDLFASGAPDAAAELRAAADGPAAASAAHKLKSMSLNIGAARLAARLESIEERARNDNHLPGADELGEVEDLLHASLAALRSWGASVEPDPERAAA